MDPFHGGAAVDRAALQSLWSKAVGSRKDVRDSSVAPASVRHVVVRMLANLRAIHAARGDYPALLLVLDRILTLVPGSVAELRDRGLIEARLGAPGAAINDLNRYLRAAPNAGDVADVQRIIDDLERARTSALN